MRGKTIGTILYQIVKENIYFFGLFMLWLIIGAILLAMFDRESLFSMINSRFSHVLDYTMVILSAYGRGDCIPILLISLLILSSFRSRHYLFTSISSGVLLTLISFSAKQFYGCARPLVEYGTERVHTVHWMQNAFYNSFPSGHTMGAFGFFIMMSFYLPARQKIWSIFFFALALGCAYSRIYLGQHYFKDVYFGSIFGVAIVTSLYLLAELFFTKTETT